MKKSRAKSGFKGVFYKDVSKVHSKYKYLKPGYYFNLVVNGVVKTWIKVFPTARDAAKARDYAILEKGLKEPLQVLKPLSNDKERKVDLHLIQGHWEPDSDDRVQVGL